MPRWRCDGDDVIGIVAVRKTGTGLYAHAGGKTC